MRVVQTVGVLWALCSSAAFAQGAGNAAADSPPMQLLSRMAGCWRQQTAAGATIDEMWMAPAGGTMLGVSRTAARERVVAYEFMRIQADSSGVTFHARLPNQPETAFRLLTIDGQRAVFENPTHDFPQRVIYRVERDVLTGRIEGVENGKPRSVDYPMRRVACP